MHKKYHSVIVWKISVGVAWHKKTDYSSGSHFKQTQHLFLSKYIGHDNLLPGYDLGLLKSYEQKLITNDYNTKLIFRVWTL